MDDGSAIGTVSSRGNPNARQPGWIGNRQSVPVPRAELPPAGTGSQPYSGALTNEAVARMRQALHEHRDDATAKVREFSALA
jgi:hypothetical protein